MTAWDSLTALFRDQRPWNEHLFMGSLILMRITPIIFQTPFLGGKLVPVETRMALAVGLTFLVYPLVVGQLADGMAVTNGTYLVFMLKELFLGYVIGFVASELFYAMEVGGRLVDVMRGANQAEVQVPELQLRASPVGQFNFQLLLVIFCSLNGHAYFIEGLMESFLLVPVDEFPAFRGGFANFVDHILRYTASLFGIAFALVFPALFASFITDVVFGMFNRIAPQLNAYFMAMGVKAMGALFMVLVTLEMMAGRLAGRLEESLVFFRRLVGLLG